MNKYVLMFLLMTSAVYAADYVCSDKDGNITGRFTSCGAACSKRTDCMKVSREKLAEVTQYSKVDKSVVGTNDQKIVELSAEEIKGIKDAKQAVVDAQTAKVEALKTKLKGLGLTDEEISILLNSGI